jgi:hypothetical protein
MYTGQVLSYNIRVQVSEPGTGISYYVGTHTVSMPGIPKQYTHIPGQVF